MINWCRWRFWDSWGHFVGWSFELWSS